jgi:hypothetical protein
MISRQALEMLALSELHAIFRRFRDALEADPVPEAKKLWRAMGSATSRL